MYDNLPKVDFEIIPLCHNQVNWCNISYIKYCDKCDKLCNNCGFKEPHLIMKFVNNGYYHMEKRR